MSNLLLSIQITAVGMGIVFGAIILLWGMMSLLTAMLADKKPASDSPDPAPVSNDSIPAHAAAVAVAVALAQDDQGARPLMTPPTQIISAWQLGLRTRQLVEKGGR